MLAVLKVWCKNSNNNNAATKYLSVKVHSASIFYYQLQSLFLCLWENRFQELMNYFFLYRSLLVLGW